MPFSLRPPGPMPLQLGALQSMQQPPIMDSRAMRPYAGQSPTDAFNQQTEQLRALYQNPAKRGLAYQLGSIALPALVGAVAGGSGKDALLYGVGSAAFNYKQNLDSFNDVEARIAEAAMNLPQAQAQWENTYNGNVGDDPSEVKIVKYLESRGLQYGTKEFDAAYQKLKAAGFNPYFNPITYGPDAVVLPKDPTGKPVVYGGAGELSPENINLRVGQEGGKAGAAAQAQVNVETDPNTIRRVADRERAVAGGKQAGTDIATNLNMIASNAAALGTTKRVLKRIRDKIANGPSTGPVSNIRAIVEPDLQELRGILGEGVVSNLGSLKANGFSGQISDKDIVLIKELGGLLTNQKEANLGILDSKIAAIDADIPYYRSRYEKLKNSDVTPFPDFEESPSGPKPLVIEE